MENDRIQILSDHNDTTCKKQQWRKCVKQQTLCQIKPRDIQIAQHQFNSKTVYNKKRTSSHVTQTSQLLYLSLFFSVSTPFFRASLWWNGIFGEIVLSNNWWLWCLDVFCSTFLDLPHASLIDVYIYIIYVYTYINLREYSDRKYRPECIPIPMSLVFWYWPFKNTLLFDPRSVKKIEIFWTRTTSPTR